MANPDPKIIAKIDGRIKIDLFFSVLLLCLAFSFPLMAWFGILQQDKSIAVWFQRSGALTVLFAAWAEYIIFIVRERTNPIADGGETNQDLAHQGVLKTKYRGLLSVLSFISILLLVLGTIVWGYGDLIRAAF